MTLLIINLVFKFSASLFCQFQIDMEDREKKFISTVVFRKKSCLSKDLMFYKRKKYLLDEI